MTISAAFSFLFYHIRPLASPKTADIPCQYLILRQHLYIFFISFKRSCRQRHIKCIFHRILFPSVHLFHRSDLRPPGIEFFLLSIDLYRFIGPYPHIIPLSRLFPGKFSGKDLIAFHHYGFRNLFLKFSAGGILDLIAGSLLTLPLPFCQKSFCFCDKLESFHIFRHNIKIFRNF